MLALFVTFLVDTEDVELTDRVETSENWVQQWLDYMGVLLPGLGVACFPDTVVDSLPDLTHPEGPSGDVCCMWRLPAVAGLC